MISTETMTYPDLLRLIMAGVWLPIFAICGAYILTRYFSEFRQRSQEERHWSRDNEYLRSMLYQMEHEVRQSADETRNLLPRVIESSLENFQSRLPRLVESVIRQELGAISQTPVLNLRTEQKLESLLRTAEGLACSPISRHS